jgi:EAL domain-containing protein (putative c-di-GMP-specific phosphodiesterase class I)
MGEAAQGAAASAGGFAGRWKGGLTALALPGLTLDTGREGLAALRAEARAAVKRAGLARHDKVFCGGVEVRAGRVPLRHIVAAAETALAQARESAEGVVLLRVAAPATDESQPPAQMLALVAEALASGAVTLAAQVAYRVSDHRPLHTEIMARVRDASGRDVAAAEFLPAVSAQGLAEQLDRAVIERVAQLAPPGAGAISVNLSIRSLEQEAFVQWLVALLRRQRELAARLVFEVAETAAERNETAVVAFALELAGTGAALALDNFGLRRDSLALAQRLRPAYIKLAGTHIATMVSHSGARFYAESLIAAASQLDIPVIAQNVDDEAVFQAIAGLGFAGYQGDLGGRPALWRPKV